MQTPELYIRDLIDNNSIPFTGSFGNFRAVPTEIIRVIAESDLDRVIPGGVIRDSSGAAYVLVGSQTVASHLLLTLVPVPGDC